MRYAFLLVLLLLLLGCGTREITGSSPRLAPDQIAWIERCAEDDFGSVSVAAGERVKEGTLIVRANGEAISGRPILQAAKRGLVRAGAIESAEGAESALLIKGELNLNAFAEGRSSVARYVLELQAIDVRSNSVRYAQSYVVVNRYEQQRWK